MDNVRLFLWVGLGILLWITVTTWQRDYAPAPATTVTAPAPTDAAPAPTPPADLPQLPEMQPAPDDAAPAVPAVAAPAKGRTVKVRTDVLEAEIDLTGGDLRGAWLLAYPKAKDRPDEPVQLLSRDPATLSIFRTGVRDAAGGPEATHVSPFNAAQTEYQLEDGADELEVPLRFSEGGITVDKIYRFRRGRYDVAMEQRVTNASADVFGAVPYLQIQRKHVPPDRSMFDVDSYSFTGPVVYDGDSYEKIDVDDLEDEPLKETISNGWLAAIQHHFLAAAVPEPEPASQYTVNFDGQTFVASAIAGQVKPVAPGETASFPAKLFVGPKLQDQLEETAEGLRLTVDYGALTVLAQPLFWVLDKVYSFVGNWGWTIVIVTFLIKLLFYKLSETSGRSMAKMRKMQPRMKALQERFKDDREAMSRALMDLYKKEKVNPAAGCLPMLVQIPFFIAFYWVLLESVEMRQAPFMLWIQDLSVRDPFFILPLLMGAAMWFQQKLNPAPPDPVQAKVMMFLPVVFTGMFAFFPAGLVLYWLTNSLLSMAQQWKINKAVEAG
ncbi:MAG: membrane protein insertase YidC [Chromatiales bacterium]|nr:MAG: membrane protein insertase YidC [Chromatiales bacterium]